MINLNILKTQIVSKILNLVTIQIEGLNEKPDLNNTWYEVRGILVNPNKLNAKDQNIISLGTDFGNIIKLIY